MTTLTTTGFLSSDMTTPGTTQNVYLNAFGQYYAATSPQNAADQLISFPSQALLDGLANNTGQVISVQSVDDALATAGDGDPTQYTDTGVT